MLDDTCYFIGFNHPAEAEAIQALLQSAKVKGLLQSLIFSDAKRSITKELLMRIDLGRLMQARKITL